MMSDDDVGNDGGDVHVSGSCDVAGGNWDDRAGGWGCQQGLE